MGEIDMVFEVLNSGVNAFAFGSSIYLGKYNLYAKDIDFGVNSIDEFEKLKDLLINKYDYSIRRDDTYFASFRSEHGKGIDVFVFDVKEFPKVEDISKYIDELIKIGVSEVEAVKLAKASEKGRFDSVLMFKRK